MLADEWFKTLEINLTNLLSQALEILEMVQGKLDNGHQGSGMEEDKQRDTMCKVHVII